MIRRQDDAVHMIPLDQIRIVNPRSRGKAKFKQLVANIGNLGLKRPITVTPKSQSNGAPEEYILVCGQGRYEAYQALGQSEIPALIVEASNEDVMLMSLVENLARRQYTTVELLNEIKALKDRGYTFKDISAKTALDLSYVKGIVRLLNHGEERLLQAVERQQIPLNVAITIATADDDEVQRALTQAYENNDLRGKRLIAARKIIENRRSGGKKIRGGRRAQNASAIASQEILAIYQEETRKQRIITMKAKLCETKLLFLISAFRQLFNDTQFLTLLKAESLADPPTYLADQAGWKKVVDAQS